MYHSPIAIEHSATLKAVNALGALIERCGIRLFELDRDRILAKAAEKSGHSFADDDMAEGLGRLIASINADAQLNAFGKFAFKTLIQRMAEVRFKVEKAIAERPEILDDPIAEPLFIIGMPRTGTTILQALLSRDAAHRSPLCWECLLPHPAPTPEDYRDNDRIDTIRTEFDQLFKLVPDFRRKHYMEADSPQECIAVTALNFTSFQFMAQAYLGGYSEWFLDSADQAGNFRWHRRFLQFLQSGGVRTPRWLLKSPVHLMRLRALFDAYPDARIIMTHRHPAHIVPSITSLLSSTRSLYSNQEEVERSGREQLQLWARYFNRFLEDRQRLNREDQFVDVLFDEFADDQMAVVRRIYDRFGWRLDGASAGLMEDFLSRESMEKHGRHEYSLETIGVQPAQVETHYRSYIDFLGTLSRVAPSRRIA